MNTSTMAPIAFLMAMRNADLALFKISFVISMARVSGTFPPK